MALFLAFSLKKRRFFVLKVEVLSARNSGFRTKKRWFLKFIHIFVGIKNIYHADYQYLLYNTQNKRFCNRRTTRLQISAVCMLRTSFLLILFASIVGAWFITFLLSAESITRVICFSEIAERDKSRPYACRQITTISQIMEDTKPKEIFLVILIIWNTK